MIDKATIEKILDAANIVEVISEFVSLHKRGVNYIGLCPFHEDATPSFSVSPSKGICKCFSCGKGGNVVHFLMEHDQFGYYDALRWLAKKYHIEVEEREMTDEEKKAQSERESILIVNEYANDYFQRTLTDTTDGVAIGMAYLRARGFRDDSIKRFQLGYCLPDKKAFAREALRKGYKWDYLLESGLCYKNNDGTLTDRFWGRVIFPIHSISGKVVAFGGRLLDSHTKGVKMKYVNSPESSVYHKSNELYGLFFAKQAIVKQNKCFLVEGYTDVISMYQAGVENVVASSGTALTKGQIRLIHRFTENITILYDGDSAGIHASLRGIDLLLEEGMNVRVVLLPDGEDPDSFAKGQHGEGFQKYIENHEVDFIRFKVNLLLKDCADDPIKKAELIQDIVKSISVIPNQITRSIYLDELSKMLHMDVNVLVAELNKLLKQGKHIQPVAVTANPDRVEAAQDTTDEKGAEKEADSVSGTSTEVNDEFIRFERELIGMVVRYGEEPFQVEDDDRTFSTTVAEFIYNDLAQSEIEFHVPLHKQMMMEALAHVKEEGFDSEHYFVSHPDLAISTLAVDLCRDKYSLSKVHERNQLNDEGNLMIRSVYRTLMDYKNAIVQEEMKQDLAKLGEAIKSGNQPLISQLMEHYQRLQGLKQQIAQRTGAVL